MNDVLKKPGFPVGAFLLPVYMLLNFAALVVSIIVDMVFFHAEFSLVHLGSIFNFNSIFVYAMYIVIFVLAIMKKPQWTAIPFAVLSLLSLWSILSTVVNFASAIFGGWLNFQIAINFIVGIIIGLIYIVVYLSIVVMAIECFGKFSKPIVSRLWFIPGVLVALALILRIADSLLSWLIPGFGYTASIIIANLITFFVSIIPTIVYVATIFFIAKWLGDSAKQVYAAKSMEDTSAFVTDECDTQAE